MKKNDYEDFQFVRNKVSAIFLKLYYCAINICRGSGSLSSLHMHNGSKITLTNAKPVIKKVIIDYIHNSFIILI
jgi:hypothetical protein